MITTIYVLTTDRYTYLIQKILNRINFINFIAL
jgi:hypothetical protein